MVDGIYQTKTNHLLTLYILFDWPQNNCKTLLNTLINNKYDIISNLFHYYGLSFQFEVIRFTLKMIRVCRFDGILWSVEQKYTELVGDSFYPPLIRVCRFDGIRHLVDLAIAACLCLTHIEFVFIPLFGATWKISGVSWNHMIMSDIWSFLYTRKVLSVKTLSISKTVYINRGLWGFCKMCIFGSVL